MKIVIELDFSCQTAFNVSAFVGGNHLRLDLSFAYRREFTRMADMNSNKQLELQREATLNRIIKINKKFSADHSLLEALDAVLAVVEIPLTYRTEER